VRKRFQIDDALPKVDQVRYIDLQIAGKSGPLYTMVRVAPTVNLIAAAVGLVLLLGSVVIAIA
jgi:hypothetical protein